MTPPKDPPTWGDVWRETKGWTRDAIADALEAFAAKVSRFAGGKR